MDRKSKNGFTLIELIVVMVIISILATVAIVKYPVTSNRDLVNARSRLMKDIRIAQTAAISQKFFCGVKFDLVANKYWLYTGNHAYSNIITDPTNQQQYIVDLSGYGSVKLHVTDLAGEMVQFNQKGVPFDEGGKLTTEKSVTLIDAKSGNTTQIFVLPGTGLVKY
ncbi:MAG: type II secretion system protein [Candidatus Margulisiibacteriota bacterium]